MAKYLVARVAKNGERAYHGLFDGITVFNKEGDLRSGVVELNVGMYTQLLYQCSGHVVPALKYVDPAGVSKWRRDLTAFLKRTTQSGLRRLGTNKEVAEGLLEWLKVCEQNNLWLVGRD